METQQNPLAAAVVVEAGGVELALGKVFVAGLGAGALVFGRPLGLAHELVDVFIATIATHIDRKWLALYGLAKYSGFMHKSAQRNSFGWCGFGPHGVDLCDVAKAVGLVAKILFGGLARPGQVPAGKTHLFIAARDRVPALG